MNKLGRATKIGLMGVAIMIATAACSSGGGGAKSFTFMSTWTQTDPIAPVLKAAIVDFTAQTGIKVNTVWVGQGLSTKLAPVLATGKPTADLLDFGCSDAKSRLYDAKQAADLSNVLDAKLSDGTTIRNDVSTAYLETGSQGGNTYCIPYEGTSEFDFWFNAARFPKLLNSPPLTWTQFKNILSSSGANHNGKGALALDGDIDSYAAVYFVDFAVSAAGKGSFLAAASDKTGQTFKTNPAFLQAAQQVESLVKGGYFIKGYDASKFPAIETGWANNKSDFILNGSWLPGEVGPSAAPSFQYASFPFPALQAGGVRPLMLDSIGFVALKNAANVENAKKFISFFMQKKYQDMMGKFALPARTGTQVGPTLVTVQKDIADPTVTKIRANDGVTAAYGAYTEQIFQPLAQKLALGTLSASKFIDEMASQTASYWSSQK